MHPPSLHEDIWHRERIYDINVKSCHMFLSLAGFICESDRQYGNNKNMTILEGISDVYHAI